MTKSNFKFYMLCTVLIVLFLGGLGYAEVIKEENNSVSLGDSATITYSYTDNTGVYVMDQTTTYLVGSDQFTEEFDTQLLDTTKGDQKVIDVTYPSDYADTTVAGATISYNVSVDKVLKCTGSTEACLSK